MPKPKQKIQLNNPEDYFDGRLIKYKKITHEDAWGDQAITAYRAKELLGWQDESQLPGGYGADFLFKDIEGKKIRLLNNELNRPFDLATSMKYAQDILKKNWAGPNGNGKTVNGEAVLIGLTGQTISAQHRLVALVLACQKWHGLGKDGPMQKIHWQEVWDREPVIDSIITYGIDESPETLRSLDNVRRRTMADVFFSEGGFRGKDYSRRDRTKLCKIADFAIRFLWSRTGAIDDPFSPQKTNTELMEFLDRHKKVAKAVEYIYRRDVPVQGSKKKAISRYISLGSAAGLLYLMGLSGTSPEQREDYRNAEPPSEDYADFSMWEKAEYFWKSVAESSLDTIAVRNAITTLANSDGQDKASRDEVVAIFCKAWGPYSTDRSPKDEEVVLVRGQDYEIDEETDTRKMIDWPRLTGIDFGDPKSRSASGGGGHKSTEPVDIPDEDELAESQEEESQYDALEEEMEDLSPDGPNDEDPSPEDLAKMQDEIQNGWPEEERQRRLKGEEEKPKRKRNRKTQSPKM